MNVDDELRRLFHDDRLDVAVRPDAEQLIVAGARRVRRRRFATATAGAVAVAVVLVGGGIALAGTGAQESLPPAVSTTTPPPTISDAPVTTTEPPAVRKKSANTAKTPPPATEAGEKSETTSSKPPPAYSLDTILPRNFGPLWLEMSEQKALATGLLGAVEGTDGKCTRYTGTFGGHVLVSANLGIVRIGVTAPVATPEGIHISSTVGDVRTAYPVVTDYRMGLKTQTFSFIIGGPGDYYTPWPDTSPVERIDIDMTSDCANAL
ncbi:MAG: hypothetical protein ACRDSK_03630 [Actinophytocola sp.]|uniref:hypothetical protein n=1 Tax=Actinophytocola sp. TaxID=1872138 RepID=UPI003D6A03E4